MKPLIGIALLLTSVCTFAQGGNYSGRAGKDPAFSKKYSLTVTIDENTNQLLVKTTAPLKKIIFSTYTVEQLKVRKGTDYPTNFSSPKNSFSYDLNKPAYKDKHAYWLKFYTTDGLFEEYYLQQKSATQVAATGEEVKDDNGATIIQTNISCEAGTTQVMKALQGLDGVSDVKIDAKGKITIQYSSDGTPYTKLLTTINENGFEANGQKPSNINGNPCNLKNPIR